MKIIVYTPIMFRSPKVNNMDEMIVKEGSTLRSVLRELKIPLLASKALFCVVNHEKVPLSYRLKEGDVISFLTPISGG